MTYQAFQWFNFLIKYQNVHKFYSVWISLSIIKVMKKSPFSGFFLLLFWSDLSIHQDYKYPCRRWQLLPSWGNCPAGKWVKPNFSSETVDELEKAYLSHGPGITLQQRRELGKEMDMTQKQIKDWFNRRKKKDE